MFPNPRPFCRLTSLAVALAARDLQPQLAPPLIYQQIISAGSGLKDPCGALLSEMGEINAFRLRDPEKVRSTADWAENVVKWFASKEKCKINF